MVPAAILKPMGDGKADAGGHSEAVRDLGGTSAQFRCRYWLTCLPTLDLVG